MDEASHISAVMPVAQPPISVVIRTFNSAKTLIQVLERLKFAADDELIVVDSGSTDQTLAIAEQFGARVVPSPKPFHYSRALNAGFRSARNPWVLALSSHAIPVGFDLLGHYQDAVAGLSQTIVCISGGVFFFTDSRKPVLSARICTPLDYQQGTHFMASNVNCLYRKSVWERHPFNESVPTAEDAEWAVWAFSEGYSLMSLPIAAVLYRSRIGCIRMLKKGYNEGREITRLAAAPPLRLFVVLTHMVWLLACALRAKIPFAVARQRFCYIAGDFIGRRAR